LHLLDVSEPSPPRDHVRDAPQVRAHGRQPRSDLHPVQRRQRPRGGRQHRARDEDRGEERQLEEHVHPVVQRRGEAQLVVGAGRELHDALGGDEASPEAEGEQVGCVPGVHASARL